MNLAERVAAERAAQGLPPHVTDRATLARVVALIRTSDRPAVAAPPKRVLA